MAKKAENGVWGGNLQVTPLHRGHRREGAGLLSFWGVGEMSFVIEKVVSEYVPYVKEDATSIETTKENNSER